MRDAYQHKLHELNIIEFVNFSKKLDFSYVVASILHLSTPIEEGIQLA